MLTEYSVGSFRSTPRCSVLACLGQAFCQVRVAEADELPLVVLLADGDRRHDLTIHQDRVAELARVGQDLTDVRAFLVGPHLLQGDGEDVQRLT